MILMFSLVTSEMPELMNIQSFWKEMINFHYFEDRSGYVSAQESATAM